jgi:hypothetical protein
MISERIFLPCSGTPAKIDNWPAFWLVTTTPNVDIEIDVMEGLHGLPAWHYHYLNAQGANAVLGGSYPNTTGCGTEVTYKIIWITGAVPHVNFYAAGTRQATVAGNCAGLPVPCFATDGTPVATGPMYAVNDYENDNGTESGPLVNGVSMQVRSFTGTRN